MIKYDIKKAIDAKVRSECRIAHRIGGSRKNPFNEGTPEYRTWEKECDKIFEEEMKSSIYGAKR